MSLPIRECAILEPSPQVLATIQQLVRRTCDHMNLLPTDADRRIYECANCGHQARATFGHLVRWRDDA
jgi:hypothetical protein